jgi:integrase
MSRGNITRRGKSSWRLKIERKSETPGGKPKVFTETVKGKRQDAEKRLTELLGQIDTGKVIEPDKTTVEEYIVEWLGRSPKKKGEAPPATPSGISPKTAERYRELAEAYIYPHVGSTVMQKLRPAQIDEWQEHLLKRGGAKGRPLSAQTVNHARRVLHRALERAVSTEILGRNVVANIDAPKIESVDDSGAIKEIQILTAKQIVEVLQKLAAHVLHPIADTGLASGMRRGELLALDWPSLDLETRKVKVRRSLEETKAGLRFKPTKNRKTRELELPADTVAALRAHRKAQLEQRMALGLGKPPADALVFCRPDGSPIVPSWLSYTWRNTVASRKLPKVNFHALRHTHASALIDAGLNVEVVSRRLGHSSAAITLKIYSHLFDKQRSDAAAADAIAAAMRGGK